MANRYQSSRPYPAADDYHRGNDPQSPSEVESDPLAELARLIGQTDPFGNGGMSRANLQPQPRPVAREQYHPPIEAEEEQPLAGPPPWMQRANRREAPQPDYPGQNYPAQNYPDQSYPEQAYQAYDGSDQNYPDQVHPDQAYPDQHYPSAEHPLRRYMVQHPESVHQDYPQEPSFEQAEQPLDPSRYDEALFGPFDNGQQDVQYAQAYSDDPYAYQDSYEDEVEEEAPRRRGGLTTVVAVLALAVVGTGAAFAYRTYMGAPRNGEPPIIKADTSPTKIIPASATDSNKVPDRLASADGTEKIVPREEAPVDVNASVNSGPQTIFPPPNQSQNPTAAANVTPGAPQPGNLGNGLMPNSQPRPIKTLTVSGDEADATNTSAPPPTPQPPASKPPAVRTVRTAPASTANAYANAGGPLSLAPQAIQSAAPHQQVATNAPEPITPSAPSVASGGYMVQVSSQRNEADAQASYRVLQGKFPTVLGSRSPTIRRADLGEKGVYYRAMVGPFGSAEEASQFCGNLKSIGGQCVVQRN
ncbi:MAG TPA: SPOR domain-containing protein [Bradyrhizobium sp.]|nr:SPOR domain-containing protein [Bradyrhizobium sp.]